MNITEVSGSELTHLPAEQLAVLIGEFNHEARCAAFLATPTDTMEPTTAVAERLAAFDAFRFVPPKRFNVQGILSNMPDVFVAKVVEPSMVRKDIRTWVKRDDGFIGNFFAGAAGAMMAYSYDNNRPLRAVIGEKRVCEGQMSSTEIRLAVLAAVRICTERQKAFTTQHVMNIAEECGVAYRSAYTHLKSLVSTDMLRRSPGRLFAYEYAKRKDDSDPAEEINNLLTIVGKISIGDVRTLENGTERGAEIIQDADILPHLIQRSYVNSSHTGKSTKHKS